MLVINVMMMNMVKLAEIMHQVPLLLDEKVSLSSVVYPKEPKMENNVVTWLGEFQIPDEWREDKVKEERVDSEDMVQGESGREWEDLEENGRELEEVESKGVCPSCFKRVGENVKRHLRENCRMKKENMKECVICEASIFKSRYQEHLEGRKDKHSGKMIIMGCREKGKNSEKVVCRKCGLSVNKTWIRRHESKFHKISIKNCFVKLVKCKIPPK